MAGAPVRRDGLRSSPKTRLRGFDWMQVLAYLTGRCMGHGYLRMLVGWLMDPGAATRPIASDRPPAKGETIQLC